MRKATILPIAVVTILAVGGAVCLADNLSIQLGTSRSYLAYDTRPSRDGSNMSMPVGHNGYKSRTGHQAGHKPHGHDSRNHRNNKQMYKPQQKHKAARLSHGSTAAGKH